MISENVTMGIFLFCQIIVGVLGNFSILFLLCHFDIHWKAFTAQRLDYRALDFCQLLDYHLKRHSKDNVIFWL